MPRKVSPYTGDPFTGESTTRAFVEKFLEQFSGPVVEYDAGKETVYAPIYDRIFGASALPQEVLYIHKPRNPTKRYIGRAARCAAGNNPDEFLWCLKADVSAACRKLDTRARIILARKYIADESHEQIALRFNLNPRTIDRIVCKALDRLAAILDHTET